MLVDYQQIAIEQNAQTIADLHKVFWDIITDEWTGIYTYSFPKHGEISIQKFWDAVFVIDHIRDPIAERDMDNEFPDTRVVGFFGISTLKSMRQNRTIMRRWGLLVALFIEENKHRTAQCTKLHLLHHHAARAIKTFAHIGLPAV